MAKYKYPHPPIDKQPENVQAIQDDGANSPFPAEGFQSTLQIIKEEDLATGIGNAGKGQVMRSFLKAETPTDGIRVHTATYEEGADEPLHWHMASGGIGGGMNVIIVSGRFIMKDINLKEHELTPGTFAYAPNGLEGAHSWEPKMPKSKILMVGRHDLGIPGPAVPQWALDPRTLKSYLPPGHIHRAAFNVPPIVRMKSRKTN